MFRDLLLNRAALAALSGVAIAGVLPLPAKAAEMVLTFSGTYTDATVSNGGIPDYGTGNNATTPSVPVGLIGSSFSGSYYFDSDATNTSSNPDIGNYSEVNQGIQTNSYITQDQTAPTQSSISFNMLNYQLSNRRSNTIADTIQVQTFPTSTPKPTVFDGIHILPSTTDPLPGSANIAGAPIIPLASLGVDPNSLWYGQYSAYTEDGTLIDGNNEMQNWGIPSYPFFTVADALELSFEFNSPPASVGLPGVGTSISDFSSATLSFQTFDNFAGQFDYQDIISVVGTINSVSISEVPEPSSPMKWIAIGGVLLAGVFLRSKRSSAA